MFFRSATALFYYLLHEDPSSTKVHAFDLGKPVLDFEIDTEGIIWVCVDANFSTPEAPSSMIHILKVDDAAVSCKIVGNSCLSAEVCAARCSGCPIYIRVVHPSHIEFCMSLTLYASIRLIIDSPDDTVN